MGSRRPHKGFLVAQEAPGSSNSPDTPLNVFFPVLTAFPTYLKVSNVGRTRHADC